MVDKRTQANVRLPDYVMETVRAMAAERQWSLSRMIQNIVVDAINKQDKEGKPCERR